MTQIIISEYLEHFTGSFDFFLLQYILLNY